MKILLNVFTTDIQEQDFIELSEPYSEKGFSVFNFQFPLTDFYLDMVDTLLNYLTSEHNISPYEEKIVLQSNISNLLIAWYRLYNDVVDDFVLIDRKLVSFQSKDALEGNIISQLSSFSVMEKDPCHGRFYYRYSRPINQELLKSLMESYQYNLVKPFDELDLHMVNQKEKVLKGYKYKKQYYKRVIAKDTVDVLVDLNERRVYQNNIQINEITRSSGYFFTFVYILDLSIQDDQKAQAAMLINQQMSDEDKQKVTVYILNYIAVTETELSYKQVINLYSFLVMLGTDNTIMKQMLKYINKDDSHFNDHYTPFTNALFYLARANQREYEDNFLDRLEIMRKLKAYYKPELKIKAHQSDNRLVIVAGQLLSYNHAPTKIVIDYANNLVKYYPKMKIKIVVEDMFNYSPNELFFVYAFTSADSGTVSKEHKQLLHPSIEVHYSKSSLSRKKRLQDDINAITRFRPKWILKIGAPDSLAVDQLFDYYPVSSMSNGGAEYSECVHVPFGGRSVEEVLAEREQKGLSNEGYRYEQHTPGLTFPKSRNAIRREEYELKTDDFVIVTVGNRLETEIDETFAERMKNILQEHNHIKWLIVGIGRHEIISSTFQNIINQVIFISYAQNLMDVYAICDVYANPFRQGGGISVAMAMFAGLPISNLLGQNDANMYVPNGKAKSMENYFEYIQRLSIDKNYCKREGKIFQNEFIEKFGFEQAISHLISMFKESEL